MGKILYKYVPTHNEEYFERAKNILKGKIYFSTPSNFNDPFELSAKIDSNSNPAIHGLKKSEQIRIRGNLNRKSQNALTEDWKESIGILCLTENPLDTLMWSHYAFNHTGICIGFDTTYEPFSDAKKVIYSESRPKAKYGSSPTQLLKDTILTKAINWAYEKESRIIKKTTTIDELEFYKELYKTNPESIEITSEIIASHGGSGIYNFETASIKSIHFGARSSEQHIQKIMEEIKAIGIRIKTLQIQLDKNHYKLNTKLIKSI